MGNFIGRITAYYANARHQAGRRKSPWNFLLIILGFVAWMAAWYGLFRLIWMFHIAIYPEHQFRDFWNGNISFRSFSLSFLMVFSLMPVAMLIGFLFANSVLFLSKPIRQVFDIEAHNHKGTDFSGSMRRILKVCAWALPIGVGVALAAAYFLKSLQ